MFNSSGTGRSVPFNRGRWRRTMSVATILTVSCFLRWTMQRWRWLREICPGQLVMSEGWNEKKLYARPLTFDPPRHAADSLSNVYSLARTADRYLVNQRVSCPWSNSCHHLPPSDSLFAPRQPLLSPSRRPCFSIYAFIGPLPAIHPREFTGRAFARTDVLYVRTDTI